MLIWQQGCSFCMQGCEPDVKDRDDCTPLYCAAAWNRAEAVKCLDAMGCPSWVRSTDQRTAVHVAAEQGWTELIDLLVRQFKNKVCSFALPQRHMPPPVLLINLFSAGILHSNGLST